MADTKTILEIVEEIEMTGELEKSGEEYQMRCPSPDHVDSQASCYINPDKDVFFCFGCRNGGGPVHFYALAHNVPPVDAAKAVGYSSWAAASVVQELRKNGTEKPHLAWILKKALEAIEDHHEADKLCVTLSNSNCTDEDLLGMVL